MKMCLMFLEGLQAREMWCRARLRLSIESCNSVPGMKAPAEGALRGVSTFLATFGVDAVIPAAIMLSPLQNAHASP